MMTGRFDHIENLIKCYSKEFPFDCSGCAQIQAEVRQISRWKKDEYKTNDLKAMQIMLIL